MKILLTAFDAFGGEKINPSLETLKRIGGVIKDANIYKLELPTVYGKASGQLFEAVEDLDPDYVLSLGQAGGCEGLRLEFVGINWADARIPDNEGQEPGGIPLFEDGDRAYFTNLPIKNMLRSIQKVGIKAVISYTAGTFICNDVLYSGLYYAEKYKKKYRSGFIHLPFSKEQVEKKSLDTPYMTVEEMVRGVHAAMEGMLDRDGHDTVKGGALD